MLVLQCIDYMKLNLGTKKKKKTKRPLATGTIWTELLTLTRPNTIVALLQVFKECPKKKNPVDSVTEHQLLNVMELKCKTQINIWRSH